MTLGNHDYGEHYCKCQIEDREHFQVQYGKLSQKKKKNGICLIDIIHS